MPALTTLIGWCVGGCKTSTLTGWNLWRWLQSPAPDAGLFGTAPSGSCRCEPESGAGWPYCGRLSAYGPVSTTWPSSVPPSPAGPSPMELQPATTGPQTRSRAPAALRPGRPARPCPWETSTGRNYDPVNIYMYWARIKGQQFYMSVLDY